ncbi:MAG: type II CAAX prenyl endopeptidase Rce1 family protein, partial [Clostridiaceae bacterium]
WVGVLLDHILEEQPKGNSLGMGIWLIAPFITGVLFRIFNRDWNYAGIKPFFKGNMKWYLIAFFIYPFVTLITIVIALSLKCIDLSEFNINNFILLAIASVVGGFIKNIFEEFSWRGYLTPKLIELKMKDWLIYLISGLVWSLWHAAYYMVFLPNEYFTTISRTDMLLSGCMVMTAWTIMYVEVYRLTKSVWPCVLMHAVEDAVPTVLVTTGGFITLTKGSDIWLNPTSGFISIAIFIAIGVALRSFRIKRERIVKI